MRGRAVRVTIDFDKCEGHGLCALTAPEVFWIDEDGYTQFVSEPGESERDNVIRAAQGCPALAIQVLEDGQA
ncbi:ferredoxin [Prauserella muralis]|uniref:Ferredoxin n=2 Tax=Prauserella muralis TaxID=588067 RepID=A0A2V4B596_9PSEU|nr:ferredoxin [Prauserella muralis]PXY28245.1 ferredoxin [Prauserella muralis]TWE27411.1 ferredoxin [Prauserella muralis]